MLPFTFLDVAGLLVSKMSIKYPILYNGSLSIVLEVKMFHAKLNKCSSFSQQSHFRIQHKWLYSTHLITQNNGGKQ